MGRAGGLPTRVGTEVKEILREAWRQKQKHEKVMKLLGPVPPFKKKVLGGGGAGGGGPGGPGSGAPPGTATAAGAGVGAAAAGVQKAAAGAGGKGEEQELD
jgi:hypothetical protein